MNTAKNKEITIKVLFGIAAVFSIIAAITIFLFVFARGIPAINKIGISNFLFGKVWMPDGNDTYVSDAVSGLYGISPMIVGSIYATLGALVVGGLGGFFTAVFLSKFCPKKLKGILTQFVNLLAGIPSVVYGFFGYRILSPLLGYFSPNGDGTGLLSVSLILGLMIMPTVVSLSKTSIDAVPESFYEGARALGDTHSQAVFGTVVPAKSGITASLILGIGRAIGETMAVVMLAGNNAVFPTSLFGSFRTMTANIVLEMGYAGELQMGALIATACVLFVFILIVNFLFELIANKKDKKPSDKKINKLGIFYNKIGFYFKARAKWTVKIKTILSYVFSLVSVLSLVFLIGFILINGLPNLTSELLTGEFSYGGEPTILPSILATLMLVGVSILIAVPLGIGGAIFLTEYANNNNFFIKIVRSGIQILAGIPSVIYGLFGMVFFSPLLSNIFGDKIGSTSILAGALTVSLLIIPVIIRSTEESLKSVPASYREGSLALGAGKARTIFKVVLPSAFPGILSAVILAVGRIVSESAPLMFTMGASLKATPTSILSSGTTLAVALYVLAGEGLHINQAYATACVLLIIVLALNLLSTFLVNRLHKKLVGAK